MGGGGRGWRGGGVGGWEQTHFQFHDYASAVDKWHAVHTKRPPKARAATAVRSWAHWSHSMTKFDQVNRIHFHFRRAYNTFLAARWHWLTIKAQTKSEETTQIWNNLCTQGPLQSPNEQLPSPRWSNPTINHQHRDTEQKRAARAHLLAWRTREKHMETRQAPRFTRSTQNRSRRENGDLENQERGSGREEIVKNGPWWFSEGDCCSPLQEGRHQAQRRETFLGVRVVPERAGISVSTRRRWLLSYLFINNYI